jgi:hypothetical protein
MLPHELVPLIFHEVGEIRRVAFEPLHNKTSPVAITEGVANVDYSLYSMLLSVRLRDR